MVTELSFMEVRRRCEVSVLGCETTEGLPPLEGILGQERAVRSLGFGIGIAERGFNIYVAGMPGTGRTTAVRSFLEEAARSRPVPSDWCYVNNLNEPYEPRALRLPAGSARQLQKEMDGLVEEARRAIPRAFESDDYTARRESIAKQFEKERQELFAALNEKASRAGFLIRTTPIGLVIMPVVGGKPLSDEEFLALNPQLRERIQARRDELEGELHTAMRQLRETERRLNEEFQKLNREVALYAIGHLVNDLAARYKELPELVAHIQSVRDDMVENLGQFRPEPQTQLAAQFPWLRELPFRKYRVNVLVDNSALKGAPVVIEQNPTYNRLFGRIEKEAQLGALTTDFTMIRGGSIHEANGGYLVLPIEELLRNLFAWDSLKRALKNREIAIEEPGERLGVLAAKSLVPQPIPLDVKVVLIGEPFVYSLLYLLDLDFRELFKVKAEFDTQMDRNEDNVRKYGAFVCGLCRKENLKHLDASAIAKLVEYSSRLAEDQGKLSTRFAEVADAVREASYYATQEGASYISANHIRRAVEERFYRSGLIQERIKELIAKGIILMETAGAKVGQLNGLAVMSTGDISFGRPSRVTATIGLGREGLVDIERESRLGGPIHTKGVMILGGYLSEKFAWNKPLTLSARLVFEQSYEEIEGDSASSAELYAILSALSGVPLKQSLAVTGSVNQKGEVQAIGGANEKIEGFYEVCKALGLDGKQGVVIPASNVQNLMLKEEVTEAVQAGKFHIHPVRTIDEGIEILTGMKAGARQPDGQFEEGTVNALVDKRLKEMAETLKQFLAVPGEERKQGP